MSHEKVFFWESWLFTHDNIFFMRNLLYQHRMSERTPGYIFEILRHFKILFLSNGASTRIGQIGFPLQEANTIRGKKTESIRAYEARIDRTPSSILSITCLAWWVGWFVRFRAVQCVSASALYQKR
jgi:hypothetical protein